MCEFFVLFQNSYICERVLNLANVSKVLLL